MAATLNQEIIFTKAFEQMMLGARTVTLSSDKKTVKGCHVITTPDEDALICAIFNAIDAGVSAADLEAAISGAGSSAPSPVRTMADLIALLQAGSAADLSTIADLIPDTITEVP